MPVPVRGVDYAGGIVAYDTLFPALGGCLYTTRSPTLFGNLPNSAIGI